MAPTECFLNTFYDKPEDCPARFHLKGGDEVDNQWLSNALNATVTGFETTIAAEDDVKEGTIGKTVIYTNITYEGGGGSDRPSSVVIKFHADTADQRAVATATRMYDRELYFYLSLQTDVPVTAPKVLGVWGDDNIRTIQEGGEPVEFFNLMMEDLREDNTVFDEVSSAPTKQQLQQLVEQTQKMHVQWFGSSFVQKPPLSGSPFFSCDDLRFGMLQYRTYWPKLRGNFTDLAGIIDHDVSPEMAGFPPRVHAYVHFCNKLTKKRSQAFFDQMENIMQSRSQTMIHGDLDVGNLWASQTRRATFVFTDWQMLRMGPIGYDLCKLLLTSTISAQDAKELLRSYHASLPAHVQAEYGYTALYDDVRIMATCCHLYSTTRIVSEMAEEKFRLKCPPEKFEYIWKSYVLTMFERYWTIFNGMDIEHLVNNVIEGRYYNLGKGGPEEVEAEPTWGAEEYDDGLDDEMENPLAATPSKKPSVDNRVFSTRGASPPGTFEDETYINPEDMNGTMFEREVDKRGRSDPQQENVVAGRALFCLDESAGIRHTLNDFLNKKEVDAFMLGCILLNVLILAIQTPENEMSKEQNDLLNNADHVLSAIFSIEMVGRIIALGFVMEPTSYLRNSWYVLDFVVVFSIWISWGVLLTSSDSSGGSETNISYIRTMRALRPLRSLRSFPYVKLIMSSLYDSISMFFNVGTILAFVFIIFSAIGLQLFAGATTHRCDANYHQVTFPTRSLANASDYGSSSWSSGASSAPEEEEWPCIHVDTKGSIVDDITMPCQTVACPKSMADTCASESNKCNPKRYVGSGDLPDEIDLFGFNDVRAGMMTLFIVATLDEWPQLADPLRTSELDAAWVVWIYFVLVVMFAGMLGLNLFVAVVTFAFDKAQTENEEMEAAKLLDATTSNPLTGSFRDNLTADDGNSPREFDADNGKPATDDDAKTLSTTMSDLEDAQKARGDFFYNMYRIATHPYFENFVMVVVVLNTGVLAADHHNMSDEFARNLNLLENLMLGIYTVEMIVKLMGLTPRVYFQSGFNILDITLVVFAYISLMLPALQGLAAGRLLRMLRLFRAARLIRMLKKYDAVMDLFRTVARSYKALLNVCLFIVIWLVIFAVMGIHLYGVNSPDYPDGLPRENFNSFGRSFLTCFVILSGEDWSPLMYAYVRAFGWNAAMFFLLVMGMTNFVLVNLFVAVIVGNFDLDEEQKLLYQKKQYYKNRRLQGFHDPDDPDSPSSPSFMKQLVCSDEELHCCHETNSLRAACTRLVTHPWFDNFIIVIIVLSSIALGIEGPPNAKYLEGHDFVKDLLKFADVLFFIIFWIECIAKIISMGFVFTKGGYLRDGWNQLDFAVVVLTTIDVVFQVLELDGDYAWIKVFRVARVLRPLRVASKFENVRVIVSALMDAMGGISATLGLGGFFYLIFGIISLGLFSGKLYTCQEDIALSQKDCEAAGYEWANPDQHFDNIWYALECLFVTATLEGWVEIMNNCIDIGGEVGAAPIENNNPEFAIFFCIFVILCSFFVTNLFIGVLVNSFQQSTGSAIMTESQQKWVRFQNLLLVASMTKSEKQAERELAAASGIQKTLLPVLNATSYESTMSLLILCNVVLLLCEKYPQDSDMEELMSTLNMGFLIIFTLDMFGQIAGRGAQVYFTNNWFRLDFAVVMCSWATAVFEVQAGIQAARAFRLLRVLMIFKWAGVMRSIIMTVIVSITPAINVFLTLLLLLYIYGVAGMQFYGEMPYHGPNDKFNEYQNFENIFNAMMFLFQVSTGQDFKTIMYDLRQEDGFAVFTFFGTFYTLAIFVFLNLFVAVLLEAFENEFDSSMELDLTSEDIILFKDLWDDKLDLLVKQGLIEANEKACLGLVKKPGKGVPVRYLEAFIATLPDESVFAQARGVGDKVWFNRLLYELKIEPHEVHEAVQGTGPDAILDFGVDFVSTVKALNLMRTAALEGVGEKLDGLTFAEQMELKEQLDRKREDTAKALLRASVGAWKKLRYPPDEIAEQIENDPSYRKVWEMQVVMARTLMITSILQRGKIG